MATKRKDPILPVVNYFETADLALAQQALALVEQILKRRAPKVGARPSTTPAKPKAKPVAAAAAALPPLN